LVRVVVRRRALEQEIIAGRRGGKHRGSLQFADLEVVKRDVERDRTVLDETVVTDHWHMLALSGLHDGGGLLGVVWNDDQNAGAGIEQLVGLLKLKVVVAFGILDGDFGAAIVGMGLDTLERAWMARTTVQTPFRWGSEEWRNAFMRVDDRNREALARAGEERRRRQAEAKKGDRQPKGES